MATSGSRILAACAALPVEHRERLVQERRMIAVVVAIGFPVGQIPDPMIANQLEASVTGHDVQKRPFRFLPEVVEAFGVRSEERRGGKEGVSKCRSRGSALH